MKHERSPESARETREGFKAAVAFELSVGDGGLHRWEGWGAEGLQEEGQGESDSSGSRWCALQILAGSLEPGGCGQLCREQRCDAVGGEAEHLKYGRRSEDRFVLNLLTIEGSVAEESNFGFGTLFLIAGLG